MRLKWGGYCRHLNLCLFDRGMRRMWWYTARFQRLQFWGNPCIGKRTHQQSSDHSWCWHVSAWPEGDTPTDFAIWLGGKVFLRSESFQYCQSSATFLGSSVLEKHAFPSPSVSLDRMWSTLVSPITFWLVSFGHTTYSLLLGIPYTLWLWLT